MKTFQQPLIVDKITRSPLWSLRRPAIEAGHGAVKALGQADAIRFGGQAVEMAVAVEAPVAAFFQQLEFGFVGAEEEPFIDLAGS
ncbi:MAG TPA: hypothetical protein VMY18_07440, partial [Acidobacteriota bacterium]|nr:hypothetical protein [Acidobacteriota bacterium]